MSTKKSNPTRAKPGTKGMAAADRRAQLLRIGRELFAEQGYEATSLDAIAARAGVTKPVIYRHFKSKEDLFGSIVDDGVRELGRRLAPAFAADTLAGLLDTAALTLLEFARDDPEGFDTLATNSPISWSVQRTRRRFVQIAIADAYRRFLPNAEEWAIEAASYGSIGLGIYYTQWWVNTKGVPFDDAVRELAAMFRGQLASLQES